MKRLKVLLALCLLLAFGTAGRAGAAQGAAVKQRTPKADAVIVQNNQSLAGTCTNDPNRGYGFVIDYTWTSHPPKSVASYELLVTNPFGDLVQDQTTTATSFSDVECNAFVTPANSQGWHWHVVAKDASGATLADSGTRAYSFGPCTLSDGSACSAPPG